MARSIVPKFDPKHLDVLLASPPERAQVDENRKVCHNLVSFERTLGSLRKFKALAC
jgi:hypothetical protein